MKQIFPTISFQQISPSLGILIVVFTIFFSSNTYCQRIHLEGKITAEADVDVEGINILNLSSNKGTVTDSIGGFWIAVALNDTLSVSAVHIQSTKLLITAEQILAKRISINLSEKMNELPAVTLRRSLTGYIGSDANIIRTEQPITATSVGLPNADLKQLSKTQRAFYTATSTPVDALINLVSGRTRMLKKRLEFEKTYQLTLSLLNKFPETFFTDALKIDKYKVYSFIFYCEEDPDYEKIMKSDTMQIVKFLERKSEEYRMLLEKMD
ncbi:hypothetical protein EI546_00845 [Aequorivita sp. H23M31]|uniref:Carboxypeptidase-like regulatory domain-containing protein n=1 Tax=Aequorivita ciconiae TaxID=2494375 RepID=A0A410FZE0_9FLAO|nr:hypothetical protein [Aequorivita sp. H23M31]QAA80366.1 hypothetical protein EI546_00845 [Aequorivita sp. H23M31]